MLRSYRPRSSAPVGRRWRLSAFGSRRTRQRVPRQLMFALLISVCALLIGAVAASAASDNGRKATSNLSAHAASTPSVLNVADAATVPTLDPTMTLAASSMEAYIEVFDPLLTYNNNDEVIPDLATKWVESKSGLVYKFSLAHHIRFQNGQSMTSADVVASVKRAARMGQASAEIQAVLKSVVAKGPYQVVMTLKHRYSPFLAILANPLPELPIMPAKYANMRHGLNPPDLIGTGPYSITSWSSDQATVLTKFAGYTPAEKFAPTGLGGNRTGHFQTIKLTPIAEPETRLEGLESGEFQYAENLPLTALDSIKSSSAVRPVQIAENQNSDFFVNQGPGKLLNNIDIRRAILAAINDKAILSTITEGHSDFYSLNSSLFWPQQKLWYDPAAGTGIYDQPNPKRAKALLRAGHYHGQTLTIVTNSTYQFDDEEAQVLASELKAIGMNVKLRVSTWTGSVALLGDLKAWDLFASTAIFQADPIGWNVIIAPGGALAPGFQSTKFSSLLNAANTAKTTAARVQAMRKVQRAVWTQVPTMLVGRWSQLDGISHDLSGYQAFFVPRYWTVR